MPRKRRGADIDLTPRVPAKKLKAPVVKEPKPPNPDYFRNLLPNERLYERAESQMGRSGREDESGLTDASADEYVEVYSTRGTITKILRRCGSAVVNWTDHGGSGISIRVERSAFRGIEFAFKPLDIEHKPFVMRGAASEGDDDEGTS